MIDSGIDQNCLDFPVAQFDNLNLVSNIKMINHNSIYFDEDYNQFSPLPM